MKHLKQPHTYFNWRQRLSSSRDCILDRVKYEQTGCRFPCYYELNSKLPYDYCPQLKDSFGDEGRPVGVAKPNMTHLVYDVLGDYMQILYEGRKVWIQYRNPPHIVLLPSFHKIPNFWKDILFLNEDSLYRVNSELPESVEIKVRLKPEMTAEICGYLKKNMVVRCMAVLRDWIQIRFHDLDTVWVLQASDNVVLLQELPEEEQTKLKNMKIRSPYEFNYRPSV